MVDSSVENVEVLKYKKVYTKAELMNVAVAESCQGKGIGKALVLNAVEVAKMCGMKSIELGVGNSIIQHLGFIRNAVSYERNCS